MVSIHAKTPKHAKAATSLHQEYARYGDYILTKSGSLIGAVEVYGRDPDALTPGDFMGMAWIARNIYQQLNERITITQYYAHFNTAKIKFRRRDHPICNLLSQRRETFLNKKQLASSRIVHYFEIAPSEKITQLNMLDIFKHISYAAFEPTSREALKRHFTSDGAVLVFQEELDRQTRALDDAIQAFCDRWGSISEARQLTLQDKWAHLKFLANLDPEYLSDGLDQDVPEDNWDLVLTEGDREMLSVGGMDVIKMHGERNQYARICSITQFGAREVAAGMWANDVDAPARLTDNFIIMMRFRPFTKMGKAMFLRGRRSEMERQGMSIGDALKGLSNNVQEKAEYKPAIAEKLMELEEVELVEDKLGMASGCIITFDTTDKPEELRETSRRLKNAANKAGFQCCWESGGLGIAWKSFMPAGWKHSEREIPFTSTQFGAASLVYRSSLGQQVVPDLGYEEAQYIFMSSDGTPFHYNPFIGGKGVVFGVGPIRSGKSFTKNTMATHFVKYGGLLRGLDIDMGMEPVASVFGEDGGIFRMDEDKSLGLNPFASASGPDDQRFVQHIKSLIIMMLGTNDNEEMQKVDASEQQALDDAIVATLRLPPDMQRLRAVSRHCPRELQQKMARWVEGGMYGHIFDQTVDSVGPLTKPIQAFNLAGVKDDPVVLPLVMSDVFYRVTRAFEDPRLRNIPKYFDIDEAHQLLSVPYIAKYIVRAVRTWGKWRGGIGMWTQSPKEFMDLPDWPALRSAASTFFFMADPAMDESLYRETFKLTSGECDAIRNLTPKREALIIQPELGVSKKVILEVESEQRVISTSDPRESVIRQQNFEQYGFEKGLLKTMEELGWEPTE